MLLWLKSYELEGFGRYLPDLSAFSFSLRVFRSMRKISAARPLCPPRMPRHGGCGRPLLRPATVRLSPPAHRGTASGNPSGRSCFLCPKRGPVTAARNSSTFPGQGYALIARSAWVVNLKLSLPILPARPLHKCSASRIGVVARSRNGGRAITLADRRSYRSGWKIPCPTIRGRSGSAAKMIAVLSDVGCFSISLGFSPARVVPPGPGF